MKIIISKTFEADFEKFIKKDLQKCNIVLLASMIQKYYVMQGFYLYRPFLKLKFDFCNKSIRLLVVYHKQADIIVPIFITDKNDKKYGYNMTWNIIESKAKKLFQDISKDIDNDDFIEF